jgi:dCTP diphosphatase
MSNPSLDSIQKRLRTFAEERDWLQFHSPKNLAMALTVEAGELMEHFQWMETEASRNPSADMREKIQEEMADVLIYLLRLADELDMDLEEAAHEKINRNAEKYPADRVRGSSKKYTEYNQ